MAKMKFRKRDIGKTAYVISDQFESVRVKYGQAVRLVGVIPAGFANFDSHENTPVVCVDAYDARPFTVRSDLLTLDVHDVED